MTTIKRTIAAAELLLLFPAALFMIALVARNFAPAAQRIVMWYAERLWTLWALLLALPFAALVTGFLALRSWNHGVETRHGARQIDSTKQIVTAATWTSVGVLTIVVLHMLNN